MSSYPFKWRTLHENEKLDDKYLCSEENPHHDYLKVDDDTNGFVMPRKFVEDKINEKIYNMEVRKDDLWIVTFPKCGTNWTSVIRFEYVLLCRV